MSRRACVPQAERGRKKNWPRLESRPGWLSELDQQASLASLSGQLPARSWSAWHAKSTCRRSISDHVRSYVTITTTTLAAVAATTGASWQQAEAEQEKECSQPRLVLLLPSGVLSGTAPCRCCVVVAAVAARWHWFPVQWTAKRMTLSMDMIKQ